MDTLPHEQLVWPLNRLVYELGQCVSECYLPVKNNLKVYIHVIPKTP